MKKLLNLFLILCLILSQVPLSVLAEEEGAYSDREISRTEALAASERAGESVPADLSVQDTKQTVYQETEPVTAHDENSVAETGKMPAQKSDEESYEEALAGESGEAASSENAPESYEGDPENTETLIGALLPEDESIAADNEALLGSSVIESVSYIKYSWDGTKVVSSDETAYNVQPVPSDGNMTSGWYYLNSNVTKNGRVDSITGDVNLILEDGFTLDVKGLYVPEGSTLTVYARSNDDEAGRIYSHPGKSQGGAGIGGYSGHDNGNIVIHGGNIEANGYDHCAGLGSNDGRTGGDITIYGGTVTAKGGSDGAGLGGGRNCEGGEITIYGGTIAAKGGGSNGAAIGGGKSGSGGTITIYGGTVNANDEQCNENGAAIGGGDSADGGEITINGGEITTYSRDGAGIGGGDDGDGGDITINGGTITANRVNQGQGARIGGGCGGAPGTIVINDGTVTATGGSGAGIGGGKGNKSGGTVKINGGVINATGSYGIGKGEEGSDVSVTLDYTEDTKDSISITASSYSGTVTLEQPFAKYAGSDGQELVNMFTKGAVHSVLLASGMLKAWDKETSGGVIEYTQYSWDEENQTLKKTIIRPTSYIVLTSYAQELLGGTYVFSTNTVIDHYLSVQKGATVNLIVPKGVVLTCTKGIGCGYNKAGEYATLNIFGEGTIVVNGKENAAGIGGNDNEASGNITIHGTTVKATGGKHGAGIGGGEGGKDPDGNTSIKIYTGTVTATGGIDGAGIGGGDGQPGAHTYIYSGTITADSKKHGAGIGGGDGEGTLGAFIYGGKVTATGGVHGAGIGAGEQGGNLRKAEDGGGVNICGGNVKATGGSGAAGIGGGYDENMSGTVNITGYDTKLTVQCGDKGAGIGSGSCNDSGKEGNMKGTVTIDCGSASDINITGGQYGAGIGTGVGGNMTGKFYYKNGNVVITVGSKDSWIANFSAGIGGGGEVGLVDYGGEGGTAYIGGGNLKIILGLNAHGEAIGAGYNDSCSGTVYVAAGNNKTGKYLRVDYCDAEPSEGKWKTAKASDRTDVCHDTNNITVTECNHKDVDGNSGLTYTIVGKQHRKYCKYCGLDVTEDHKGEDCECGYRSRTFTVTLNDESRVETCTVAEGKEFVLPDDDGQVMSGNEIPPCIYRVKEWMPEGDASGRGYEPGETVTVNRDMTFVSVREHLYQITFDEVPGGRFKPEFTGGKTYAAPGETLSFSVEPDSGYSVGDVTYQIMEGYEIAENGDVIYLYSEPVEIPLVDGEYQLTMPELTSVNGAENNQIIIAAEISQNTEYSVTIPENLVGGTVTADWTTAAAGATITLTVTTDPNYALESIRCRKAGGEDVELTETGETGKYTFVMPAEDVRVTAEWEAASAVTIKGVTGSFNDKIKLNYYFDIPEEVLEDENAYVTITNERTDAEITLPVHSAPFNQAKGGYRFSVALAAKEAGDTITAKMFDGSGNAVTLIGEKSGKDYTGTGVQYTLIQYFEWLEKNGSDDKEKAVGVAARDYCTAAQIYFKYHADGLSVSSAVDEVTVETLSVFIAEREGTLPAGVSISGISAMLESDNTLRLYLGFNEVKPDDFTYYIDGKEVELKQRASDKKYYLALDKGVYSNRLQDTHTYSISDGTDTYTITASVLTYARSCAIKSDESEINLGKALYLYSQAAVAAFGN